MTEWTRCFLKLKPTADKLVYQIWAKSWKNLFMLYANNKGADQPAHLHSLISSTFACFQGNLIIILAESQISKLGSVAEQAGLSLTWLQTSKTGYLMTWLSYRNSSADDVVYAKIKVKGQVRKYSFSTSWCTWLLEYEHCSSYSLETMLTARADVDRPRADWQLGSYNLLHWSRCNINMWAPSSKFVSSSIPSWQILTAHAQPFRGARDLALCLKVPLDSLPVWASSEGSGETARMRRLAWTVPARIGDKYQIRLMRPM